MLAELGLLLELPEKLSRLSFFKKLVIRKSSLLFFFFLPPPFFFFFLKKSLFCTRIVLINLLSNDKWVVILNFDWDWDSHQLCPLLEMTRNLDPTLMYEYPDNHDLPYSVLTRRGLTKTNKKCGVTETGRIKYSKNKSLTFKGLIFLFSQCQPLVPASRE